MQIRKSLSNIPWENFLKSNPDVNWQVERFTEIVLNIMSDFIRSKIIKVNPRDPHGLMVILNECLTVNKDYTKIIKGMVLNLRTRSGLIDFVMNVI